MSCFINLLYSFPGLSGNWNVVRNPGNYQNVTINSNNQAFFLEVKIPFLWELFLNSPARCGSLQL